MALAAYRQLLRATRIAFRGDEKILFAARQRIRDEFRASSTNLTDGEIQKRIQQANSVAEVLKTNVVQGVSEGNGVYKLRIHGDIERGDNESIKSPQPMKPGGGCRGRA